MHWWEFSDKGKNGVIIFDEKFNQLCDYLKNVWPYFRAIVLVVFEFSNLFISSQMQQFNFVFFCKYSISSVLFNK